MLDWSIKPFLKCGLGAVFTKDLTQIFQFFHNFHTNFHKSYAKSLGTTETGGTEEGETIFTKQKLVQYWTEIFYLLAGDDPLKLGEASKCGIHHAFNFLVRKKQQALKELMAASKANFQGTRL